MRLDIKNRWLAALRSGSFQQIKGALAGPTLVEDDDAPTGYCCLGVLCELAVQDGVAERDGDLYVAHGRVDGLILPPAVRDWAGLDDSNPVVLRGWHMLDDIPEYTSDQLSGLNDGGLTFTQIADVIEREL